MSGKRTAEDLKAQISAMRARRELDLAPATAHEALTRQMVDDLDDRLDDIEGRINGLIFAIVTAVVMNILLSLLGAT